MRRVAAVFAGLVFLMTTALSAEASFPPVKFEATREKVAAICESLGDRVSYTGWRYEPDQYGCVDTDTGNVLICEDDGGCTLYFGARLTATAKDALNRRA
jgi:hypothetical protein